MDTFTNTSLKEQISHDAFVASLTPKEIVAELEKFIVGQNKAKRAVAIALRNRWRSQQLPEDIRDEVAPKNILMIGPTGVGKTEIARRLAKLANSPFIKVEASKYTEVGYVGRDVESMVRDLVELSKNMVKEEMEKEVREKARVLAEERLIDLLLPPPAGQKSPKDDPDSDVLGKQHYNSTREKFAAYIKEGRFDERMVEVETQENPGPMVEVFGGGMEDMGGNIKDMLGSFMPKKTKTKKMKAPEAFKVLCRQEADKLIDHDKATQEALERTEKSGIIFIDEIDKIAGRQGAQGPDVSREGVQRDLFHSTKPSDLIPEFQGRFPIRVELDSLTEQDFVRILTEPDNALIKQYIALLKTEDIKLEFTDEAVREIAHMSATVNTRTENIGARRLQTIIEKLLEDISFDAPDLSGQTIILDVEKVREKLDNIIQDDDLSRYIL